MTLSELEGHLVVASDKTRRAVPLHLQSFLYVPPREARLSDQPNQPFHFRSPPANVQGGPKKPHTILLSTSLLNIDRFS